MAEQHPCIRCNVNVTGRSHAIACDDCGRWNHRKCDTGISHHQYIQLRRGELEIEWKCPDCVTLRLNSTAPNNDIPPMEMDVSPLAQDARGDVFPDVSFNVTGSFETVPASLDESLPDRELTDEIPPEQPTTYEIVPGGSLRGAPKLVSSDGFTYTRGVKSGERTYWRCAVRNKNCNCPASVKEFMGVFIPGINGHIHPPQPGAGRNVKMNKIKKESKERPFEPAASVVERVMKQMVTSNDVNIPKPENLIRAANNHRRQRPNDPKTIDFELNREFIGEDFIIDDIRLNDARHIIFGTQHQLELLRQAKRWFLDGTFKVVKEPFYQLETINVFVKKGDSQKQVPLAYVLMSRRSKFDYVQILTSIKTYIGQPSVEWFMLDFEAAAWQAIREVFPVAVIKGCVFHFTQRIYRKIQSEGLTAAYIERGDKFQYLRKLMSLPYLPASQIVPAFDHLKTVAEQVGGPVLNVISYMDRTWVRGTVWQPKDWCVFREFVRTNNDLEGWHRRLNNRAGHPNLGLYKLVTLLKEESLTVDIQIRLVSDNLLSKLRRKKYQKVHGNLENAWDKYEEDELTTTALLRLISNITGLGPLTTTTRMIDDDEAIETRDI